MKKLSKLLLVGIFAVLLTAGCSFGKKENPKQEKEEIKQEENTNEIEVENPEVFKFEKKSLEYKNGKTVIETIVKNTSSDKEYLKEFIIYIYNAKGAEMAILKGEVNNYIDAKTDKIVTSSIDIDLTKATKIEYEIIG